MIIQEGIWQRRSSIMAVGSKNIYRKKRPNHDHAINNILSEERNFWQQCPKESAVSMDTIKNVLYTIILDIEAKHSNGRIAVTGINTIRRCSSSEEASVCYFSGRSEGSSSFVGSHDSKGFANARLQESNCDTSQQEESKIGLALSDDYDSETEDLLTNISQKNILNFKRRRKPCSLYAEISYPKKNKFDSRGSRAKKVLKMFKKRRRTRKIVKEKKTQDSEAVLDLIFAEKQALSQPATTGTDQKVSDNISTRQNGSNVLPTSYTKLKDSAIIEEVEASQLTENIFESQKEIGLISPSMLLSLDTNDLSIDANNLNLGFSKKEFPCSNFIDTENIGVQNSLGFEQKIPLNIGDRDDPKLSLRELNPTFKDMKTVKLKLCDTHGESSTKHRDTQANDDDKDFEDMFKNTSSICVSETSLVDFNINCRKYFEAINSLNEVNACNWMDWVNDDAEYKEKCLLLLKKWIVST